MYGKELGQDAKNPTVDRPANFFGQILNERRATMDGETTPCGVRGQKHV